MESRFLAFRLSPVGSFGIQKKTPPGGSLSGALPGLSSWRGLMDVLFVTRQGTQKKSTIICAIKILRNMLSG